jgi:hypothetical protein
VLRLFRAPQRSSPHGLPGRLRAERFLSILITQKKNVAQPALYPMMINIVGTFQTETDRKAARKTNGPLAAGTMAASITHGHGRVGEFAV